MTLGKRIQSLMDQKKINQVDAAKGIGIDRSRFNLLLNDKVGMPRRETLLKISGFFKCNINWLETGEGKPFEQPKTFLGATHLGQQPWDNSSKQVSMEHEKESFSMAEMFTMTAKILESDTIYRSALSSNIRAFYRSVTQEEEMESVKRKLEKMEQQNEQISERMARMEELLLSLGAALPEKRDKAAGS